MPRDPISANGRGPSDVRFGDEVPDALLTECVHPNGFVSTCMFGPRSPSPTAAHSA